ncbi:MULTISPECIES: ABC transporter substrate-binding protein [unclassified Chelatococcus]|uniref:ABC transporter substrate-binding protein n=1 Tax=unclassified Chelatococcus TaxID=2638111 RepID=UPI001BD08A79|nr:MULTISPECIES: ABC transporter substrate-binding protein [unclassified Chelatococcus]MBS7696506.1 ABC transporter substrate-binding protein [Chelatococcus sp. YT9]MBX3555072.1 ABC transporter substrate-binding protein [Chelatococcus sp.]
MKKFFAASLLGFMLISPAWSQGLSQPDPSAPLYNQLPAQIRDKGYIVSATTGRYPPFNFMKEDGKTLQGLSIELGEEMEKVLGVPVKNEIAESIASLITGLTSNRFDFILGVVADTPERQNVVDMIDWKRQGTAFLINPEDGITMSSIDDACGLIVGIQKASFVEPIIQKQSELCVAAGKKPVTVQILNDQATLLLGLKSKRIQAVFSETVALAYQNSVNNNAFKVVPSGKNLLAELYQASATPKGSDLTKVITAAWQKLVDNGAYARLMTKWGIEDDMLPAPGLNLAKPNK